MSGNRPVWKQQAPMMYLKATEIPGKSWNTVVVVGLSLAVQNDSICLQPQANRPHKLPKVTFESLIS
jgi:hypothetical protein